MPFDPMSHWLALSRSNLSAFGQMVNAACAGVPAGADHPAPQAQAQAHLAQIIKATLLVGQQWRDLQAAAMTVLLKSQMASPATGQALASLRNIIELEQGLAADMLAQHGAMMKAILERGTGCVGMLADTDNADDVAIVLGGLVGDVLAQVKEYTGQAFTLLNSAQAAQTVLTHQALDGMIATASPAAR